MEGSGTGAGGAVPEAYRTSSNPQKSVLSDPLGIISVKVIWVIESVSVIPKNRIPCSSHSARGFSISNK